LPAPIDHPYRMRAPRPRSPMLEYAGSSASRMLQGDDMSDRPVFLYAAIYGDFSDALADYENLLDLHALKLVGTYDAALIRKDPEGKVHVEKHEKPTQHGAWGGIAVGAAI